MAKRLIRVIVFVKHLQVFLRQYGQKHTRLQGLKQSATENLAQVDAIENFYRRRKLTSRNDFVIFVCSTEAKVLEHAASRAVKAAKHRQSAKSFQYPQSRSSKTLSTSSLRAILDRELSKEYTTEDYAGVEETDDFMYLPNGMKEWLEGQKNPPFEGAGILTSKELTPFYKKHLVQMDGSISRDFSPIDMILGLMNMQIKNKDHTSENPSIVDDLTYYVIGEFSVVKVKCTSYDQPLVDDNNARWSVTNPNRYVSAKTTRHKCIPGPKVRNSPRHKCPFHLNLPKLLKIAPTGTVKPLGAFIAKQRIELGSCS